MPKFLIDINELFKVDLIENKPRVEKKPINKKWLETFLLRACDVDGFAINSLEITEIE